MAALATLDSQHVVISVSDAFAAQILSRRAAVGSNFVETEIFHEPDKHIITDALARSASGGMEQVNGVRVFCSGFAPNAFPRNAVFDWTLLKHNDGYLAIAERGGNATTELADASEAEELRDFFNKAPIALHWLSSRGKVLWANDRELEVLGYSREEYIGSDIMEYCPDSRDDVLEIFKQLGTGNTIRDVPVRFRTKTGTIQNLLIDSNVNYKSDGSFNHTRCFIRDDTARIVRESRAELAVAHAKMLAEGKERFSSKLLHHVKTPLHIMTMSMSDPNLIDVPLITSQLRALSSLVGSVAKAMKFDQGYVIQPIPKPVNLSSLLKQYKNAEGVRHNVVVEEVDFDTSLMVLVDASMLRTVLDELVAHADGRCPPGDSITLSVMRSQGSGETGEGEGQKSLFKFRVMDRGPTLDEARVEKVFHNYWVGDEGAMDCMELKEWEVDDGSVDTRTTANLSSSGESDECISMRSGDEAPGLKLNVAFNYVQCLDSKLHVVSQTPNTTFEFTLTLPVSAIQEELGSEPHRWNKILSNARSPRPALFPSHEPGRSVFASSQCHVLVADDNTICQKMCKRALVALGHTVDTADNGAIALEMATCTDVNIYDLVLMDIRMPVMDGVAAALKIHEIFPELPIVGLSAEEGESTQAAALDVMAAFVAKPATARRIQDIVEEYARRPLVRPSQEGKDA